MSYNRFDWKPSLIGVGLPKAISTKASTRYIRASLGEGFGSVLDLDAAKPLMISELLESIELLSNGINSFVKYCLNGLKVNQDRINSQLQRDLMIVTNLVPIIGYDKASEIAKRASSTGKTVKETILEMKLKIKGNLD